MVTLRPFQKQLESDVYAAWGAGARNVLAVAPTGSGKTVVFSKFLADHQGASVAIAHRQELVSQISLALARNEVRHRIIGSDALRRQCTSLHMLKVGRSFYDPNARCAAAGVDTLVRMDPKRDGWFSQVTLWVQDECFVAGTLIDGRPIETIQAGEYVTAFNEETNQLEQRQVVRTFCNPAPKNMMRIATSTHHVLYCTPAHPFWTKRGWVPAGKLTTNDEVLTNDGMHVLQRPGTCDNRVATVPPEKNRADLLQEVLRIRAPGRAKGSNTEAVETAENRSLGEVLYVRSGRRLERASPLAMGENGPGVLWPTVLGGVPVGTIVGNNVGHKPSSCVGTNENTQPDETPGSLGKNAGFFESDWAQTEARRKRE